MKTTRNLIVFFAVTTLVLTPVVQALGETIYLKQTTWDHTSLTVYIKDGKGRWWNNDYRTAAIQALDRWNDANDYFASTYSSYGYVGDVDLTMTGSRKAADIEISFAFYRRAGSEYVILGVSQSFTHRATNVMKKARITIYVASNLVDPSNVADTITHELGHALGLRHTDVSGDLMSEVANGAQKPSTLDVYGVSQVFGWHVGSAPFPGSYLPPPSATLPSTISYVAQIPP